MKKFMFVLFAVMLCACEKIEPNSIEDETYTEGISTISFDLQISGSCSPTGKSGNELNEAVRSGLPKYLYLELVNTETADTCYCYSNQEKKIPNGKYEIQSIAIEKGNEKGAYQPFADYGDYELGLWNPEKNDYELTNIKIGNSEELYSLGLHCRLSKGGTLKVNKTKVVVNKDKVIALNAQISCIALVYDKTNVKNVEENGWHDKNNATLSCTYNYNDKIGILYYTERVNNRSVILTLYPYENSNTEEVHLEFGSMRNNIEWGCYYLIKCPEVGKYDEWQKGGNI